jgi:4-hydroxybenzoate polyprenyltransferase
MVIGLRPFSLYHDSTMLARIRRFLEMIRFSHTVFALPFALVSALLAWQRQPFRIVDLIGILLCMVFGRSTAMAFNRLADRRYDASNRRTAQRHLPAGKLSVAAVWTFTVICALGFVASTFLFYLSGNPWPAYLSLPILGFVAGYSYTKRFTALSHFWLGASLLLAPLGAWIAVCGLQDLQIPLCLGLAVLFWVAGFDILYACQDLEFDRQSGLASIPARLGLRTSFALAALCHFLMVVLLIALYWLAAPSLGAIYLIGVALVAILLAYEHWLVRPDDLARVNQAFFNVNGVISVGLFVIVLLQLAFR